MVRIVLIFLLLPLILVGFSVRAAAEGLVAGREYGGDFFNWLAK